jgi:hypothetical protein
MTNKINHKGVSLIAALFILVILGFMGVMFVSLIGTSSLTSVNDLQSGQALYVARGGVEYILQNRGFPNYSMNAFNGGATMNLGAGSFAVATPAYLTVDPLVANPATITVNSPAGFANPAGRIVIDSEQINCTGPNVGNTFTTCARAQGGTSNVPHPQGNAVYPAPWVTIATGIADPTPTITVSSTAGFMIPGVIRIGNEFIYCTAAPTATTFTGCARGYKNTINVDHAVGSPVFQYVVQSTATVGNASRSERVAVWGTQAQNIAFDARSTATANAISFSWNHNVAGTNRILLVGVSIRNAGSQTVNGITYATQPLTLIRAQSNGTSIRSELWYLLDPPTGTAAVVVNFSASARAAGGAISLTGVDQTTPIEANNAATGNSAVTLPSVNVTTVTNNAWVVDALGHRLNPTVTVGAGQTSRWRNTTGGGPINGAGGAGSTEGPTSPAGNVTMNWGLTGSVGWAIVAAAVRPSQAQISIVQWQEVVN